MKYPRTARKTNPIPQEQLIPTDGKERLDAGNISVTMTYVVKAIGCKKKQNQKHDVHIFKHICVKHFKSFELYQIMKSNITDMDIAHLPYSVDL